MKLELLKSADGISGYITTYGVFENVLDPIVCKEVGIREWEELLTKLTDSDKYLVEKHETIVGANPNTPIFFIEKNKHL